MSDDPQGPPKPPEPLPALLPIDAAMDGEWIAPRKTMDATGHVTGENLPIAEILGAPPLPRAEHVAPPPPGELPRLAAIATGELELMRDPADRQGRAYEEPEDYRGGSAVRDRRTPAFVAIGLLLLGLGAFYIYWHSPRLANAIKVVPGGPGALVISSQPSGAELSFDGKNVGRTPWAADNNYGGTVHWEVRAKGYKAQTGTFQGGEETHLYVELVHE